MNNGTSQKERRITALSTEHFKVDERSMSDLYNEVRMLARALKFYDGEEKENSQDWSPFFGDAKQFIDKLSSSPLTSLPGQLSNCPPHLSLLLTFLKLYGHVQTQANELTSAHLNFFYTKVLGEKKKKSLPEKVYVFFELARNIDHYVLPRGEKLLAGKDDKGDNITFTTDHPVFISHAKIKQLRAIQHSDASNSSIYAFPIADSADGLGSPVDEGQGWFPFGDLSRTQKGAEIGFGFTSPMLLLKEGKRVINITFLLENNKTKFAATALTAGAMEVHLSSAKGWTTKNITELNIDKKKVGISIELAETDPPIVHYDQMLHGHPIQNPVGPMLKLILKDGYTFSQYVFLQSLRFSSITVNTKVEGANLSVVKNDYGELDANRSFHPFGYNPVRGSNFYAALEETFHKKLESLKLAIKWKGLPENFKIYYEGYIGQTNSLVRSDDDFKVKAAIRFQKKWHDIPNETDPNGEYSLFGDSISLNIEKIGNIHDVASNDDDGLIRLTLTSPGYAFGHALYPAVYAKAIIGQLQNKDAPIPNEPYTPVIEFIATSYAATEVFNTSQDSNAPFQYFHIKPFGIEQVFNAKEKKTFPQQHPLVSGEFHQAGNLFIGLQNISPPQQLSLFFEIREATLNDKPAPAFAYLSDIGWKTLSGNQILTDTTAGLQQTGFVVFNLPNDLSAQNASMNPGLFWLRISVVSKPENFDQIVSIRTNGISCTLLRNGETEMEATKVLPPMTITATAKKIKEIKKIEQPFSSFGGKITETNSDYFLRVSEQLRHKMRGASMWDIERLILAQFPDIYKVKCLQHVDTTGTVRPGGMHIIVIPYIRQYSQTKVLKPFVTKSKLQVIKGYIEKLISPLVTLHVTNPDYQEIKIEAEINFKSQVDVGFYIKKMQTDLQYFLSPWTFREGNDITLGSKLFKSSIIKFIESRPYVNFISTIRFYTNNTEVQGQFITPDEKTLIISGEVHTITAVGSGESKCQTNQGIEEMIVDINFEVQ